MQRYSLLKQVVHIVTTGVRITQDCLQSVARVYQHFSSTSFAYFVNRFLLLLILLSFILSFPYFPSILFLP
jgi:hypothetical protein